METSSQFSDHNSYSQPQCIICLDDSPTVGLLCCGAQSHLCCLGKWLKHGGTTCPQCRYNILDSAVNNGPSGTGTNGSGHLHDYDSLAAVLLPQQTRFSDDQGFLSSSFSAFSQYIRGSVVHQGSDGGSADGTGGDRMREGSGLRHARGRIPSSNETSTHLDSLTANEAMHSLHRQEMHRQRQMQQRELSRGHAVPVPVLRSPPSSRPVSLQRPNPIRGESLHHYQPITGGTYEQHESVAATVPVTDNELTSDESANLIAQPLLPWYLFDRLRDRTTTYTATVTDVRQRQVSVTAMLSPGRSSRSSTLSPATAVVDTGLVHGSAFLPISPEHFSEDIPFLCPDRTLQDLETNPDPSAVIGEVRIECGSGHGSSATDKSGKDSDSDSDLEYYYKPAYSYNSVSHNDNATAGVTVRETDIGAFEPVRTSINRDFLLRDEYNLYYRYLWEDMIFVTTLFLAIAAVVFTSDYAHSLLCDTCYFMDYGAAMVEEWGRYSSSSGSSTSRT